MEEFEFQRYITIGQYIPSDSAIHHLDPRTRVVGALMLVIAASVSPHLAGLGIALAALLIVTAVARVPLAYALKGLLPPLPFILFLAVLQIVLGPGSFGQSAGTLLSQGQASTAPLWSWGPFNVSMVSLLNGAKLVLRFPALILIITTFSACTSTTETVQGLASLLRPLRKVGLPVQDFVLMVQVALRFLPLLAREAERIAKSQASRGAEWGTGRAGPLRRVRQALPILIPLFLVSLQRAENLAVAMEARGYSSYGERTSLVRLRFQKTDVAALAACLLISLLIVLV